MNKKILVRVEIREKNEIKHDLRIVIFQKKYGKTLKISSMEIYIIVTYLQLNFECIQ
jgi:hypothetical protein